MRAYELAYQRAYQNKINSAHYFHVPRFRAGSRRIIPPGADWGVIDLGRGEHQRQFALDNWIIPRAPITCSCLRARPDHGGCGCGCDCGPSGGAEAGGGPGAGGATGGCGPSGGGQGCGCECGDVGCGAGCQGGCMGCGASGPAAGTTATTGGPTAGTSFGSPSDLGGITSVGCMTAEDEAAMSGASSSLGALAAASPADMAAAQQGATQQGGPSFGGLSMADLGSQVDLGGFMGTVGLSQSGVPGIVGTALDFAAPGTYSAVSPSAVQSALSYGSIVGPTETAVELGQSIAGQESSARANAAINAPSAIAPALVAAISNPSLNVGQISAIAANFGVSTTGVFGTPSNPSSLPAPSPPGQGIRVTDVQREPSDLGGGQPEGTSVAEFANQPQGSSLDFATTPFGDQNLAQLGTIDTTAPTAPTETGGQMLAQDFAPPEGGFAPTEFQTASLAPPTEGIPIAGGGGGGVIGGDFNLPSDIGTGAGLAGLFGGLAGGGGQQYAALDTSIVSDVGRSGDFTADVSGDIGSYGVPLQTSTEPFSSGRQEWLDQIEQERQQQQQPTEPATPYSGGGERTYGPGSQLYAAATGEGTMATTPEEERRAEQETRGGGAEPTAITLPTVTVTTEPEPTPAVAGGGTTTAPTEPTAAPPGDLAGGGGREPIDRSAYEAPPSNVSPTTQVSEQQPIDRSAYEAPPEGTAASEFTDPLSGAPMAAPGPMPTQPLVSPDTGKTWEDYARQILGIQPAEAGKYTTQVLRDEQAYARSTGQPISLSNPYVTGYDKVEKMGGGKFDSLGQPLKTADQQLQGQNTYINVAGNQQSMGRTGTITLPDGQVIPFIQTDRLDSKLPGHIDIPYSNPQVRTELSPLFDPRNGAKIEFDAKPNQQLVDDQKFGTGRNAPNAEAARAFAANTGQTLPAEVSAGWVPTISQPNMTAVPVAQPFTTPAQFAANIPGTGIDRYGNVVYLDQPTSQAGPGATTHGTVTIVDSDGNTIATSEMFSGGGGKSRGDTPDGIFPFNLVEKLGGSAANTNLPPSIDVVGRFGGYNGKDRNGYVYDPSVGKGKDRDSMELHSLRAGHETTAGCVGVPTAEGNFAAIKNGLVQLNNAGEQLYAVVRNGQVTIGPQSGIAPIITALANPTGSPYALGQPGTMGQPGQQVAQPSTSFTNEPMATGPGVVYPDTYPSMETTPSQQGYVGDVAQLWGNQLPPIETAPTTAQPLDPSAYLAPPTEQPIDVSAYGAPPTAQPIDPSAYAAPPTAQPIDPSAYLAPPMEAVPPELQELLTGTRIDPYADLVPPDERGFQIPTLPGSFVPTTTGPIPGPYAPTTSVERGGPLGPAYAPTAIGADARAFATYQPPPGAPLDLAPPYPGLGGPGLPLDLTAPYPGGPPANLPQATTEPQILQPGQQAPGEYVPSAVAPTAAELGAGHEYPPVAMPETGERYYAPVAMPETGERYYPDVAQPETGERYYPDVTMPETGERYYPDVAMPETGERYEGERPTAAERTPEEQRAVDDVVDKITSLHAAPAVLATPPVAPVTGTPRERAIQIFDRQNREVLSKLSREDRAQAEKYGRGVTDQMKVDLINGKLSPAEFMAKTANNVGVYVLGIKINVTADDIRSSASDRLAALEGRVAQAHEQLAQGTRAQQEYAGQQKTYETARSEYERGLYQSYQTAQQQQTAPPVAQPSTPFTNEAFATGPGVNYPAAPGGTPMEDWGDTWGDWTGGGFGAPAMMQQTAPLDMRPPGTPGGITPIGPDPRVDYYSLPPPPTAAPAALPQRDATTPPSSPSQVPGTTGAPSITPSATPGGVSTGSPGGRPAAGLGGIFGTLFGGGPSYFGGGETSPQTGTPTQGLKLAQLGMKMMAPPQQQPRQQNPQVQQVMSMFGVDYNTALQLMKMMTPQGAAAPLPQMQYGGRPTGPTIVGENGPEIFTPDVPGTISPMLPIPTDAQIRAATQTGPYWGSFEHTWGEIPRAIDRVPFNDAGWEKYLRAQPRSRNVEDRRNETLSDEERDRARYFDFPLGSTRPVHRK